MEFLVKQIGRLPKGHVAVSRFYPTEDSWTSSPVWWFDLPLAKLRDKTCKTVHLLCEKESGMSFRILKVPTSYVLRNLSNLCIVKDREVIRLHLSSRSEDRFVDLRGSGSVSFSQYLA